MGGPARKSNVSTCFNVVEKNRNMKTMNMFETKRFPDFFIDENDPSTVIGKVETLIKNVFPELKSLSVNVLKGGLTNRLYLSIVTFGDDKVLKTVVRTNGKKTEKIISRSKELEIFEQLSRHGGARLLSVFQNGIVYDFLPGRPLTTEDIRTPKHQAGVAKELARLHQLRDIKLTDSSVCINKFLKTWLEEVKALKSKDDTKRYEAVDVIQLDDEVNLLIEMNKKYDHRIVFCHNDLLAGNIIYQEDSNVYRFIDYEYGGMNYRGFDIGDHLAEFVGFDLEDETKNYKLEKETIMNFVKLYLQELKKGEEITEEELQEIFEETVLGVLQSHLMWGVWAIFNTIVRGDTSDFDYLEYGLGKIEIYYKEKERMSKFLSSPL